MRGAQQVIGRVLGAASVAALLLACGSTNPTPATPASSATPAVAASVSSGVPAFTDDLERMKRFHSKRFGVVVPFPDGKAWRIDDHSKDQLVATHAGTRSEVMIGFFADEELMNRQKCEAKARAMKLVPAGDLRTVEDRVTFALHDFDTRVWVAIEPPPDPARKLVGHVFAFGGFLRRCFFFHYASETATAREEDALSARLAFAKTRILGEMRLDTITDVPRERAPGLGK